MLGADQSSISLDLSCILQRSKVGFELLSFFNGIKKYSQQCDFSLDIWSGDPSVEVDSYAQQVNLTCLYIQNPGYILRNIFM